MRLWLKALFFQDQRFERSEAIELLERFERASAYDIGHGDPVRNLFQNVGGVLDESANDLRTA
jgi:hypothetical protein